MLDEPASTRREWRKAGNEQAIRDYYDSIWVYGDPAVYDTIREYEFPPDIAAKAHYTGYFDQRTRLEFAATQDIEAASVLKLPPGRIMLCTLGGGQDGAQLAEAFALGLHVTQRIGRCRARAITSSVTELNGMETKYRYIGVGKHYFSLEQSVVLLACMFVPGHGRARLAALQLTASEVLAAIIKIILYRLRIRRRARMLELPFFGNVCRRVHGGHKIFNLRRAVVIKYFSAQLAQNEVEREIVTTVARGQLNFAPTVTRYSVAQRWYEEEYILGDPGAAFYGAHNAGFWARFHGEIMPFLEQILRIEPPAPVRLGDYVDGVMSAENCAGAEATRARSRRAGAEVRRGVSGRRFAPRRR